MFIEEFGGGGGFVGGVILEGVVAFGCIPSVQGASALNLQPRPLQKHGF